jgi:hypothetical protein
MGRGIAVLSKLPRPGWVKTRFAAGSSGEWALGLHTACLADVLEREWPFESRTLLLDMQDQEWTARAVKLGWKVELQSDGELGLRIAHALSRGEQDVDSMVVIGTDSPTLPSSALNALATVDVQAGPALGPVADGGFYAIVGERTAQWAWLNDCEWSTSRTLISVIEAARAEGQEPALLQLWHDIDTVEDLSVVVAQASVLPPASEHAYIGRHVRAFVAKWCKSHAGRTA